MSRGIAKFGMSVPSRVVRFPSFEQNCRPVNYHDERTVDYHPPTTIRANPK